MRRLVACASLLMLLVGSAQAAPLNVLVSLLPQKYFAERIGGEHVQVTVLVGPGSSPENYEPGFQQMKQFSGAKIFWRMGLPFEEILQQRIFNGSSQVEVIDARAGVKLRSMENLAAVMGLDEYAHEIDGHHHEYEGADPHIWLSPANVKTMSARLKEALVHLDPEHALAYESNYQSFAAELDALDEEIKTLLGRIEQRRFMVFHPAWAYFAAAYSLRQIPIEIEGKSPGPKTLAAVIQLAREEQVKVIFVQRQFSQRDAETVAQAIGGAVVAVDPLAASYSQNLRHVARAFAEAMQ